MMSSIRGTSISERWLGVALVSERNKRQWNARAERTGMCQPLATDDRGSRTSTGPHPAMCNPSPVVRRTDRGCMDPVMDLLGRDLVAHSDGGRRHASRNAPCAGSWQPLNRLAR